jgi:hypothetical protein
MSRFLVDFGVCRPEQYANGNQPSHGPLQDRISYQLLRTSIPPSDAEIARFEDLMRQMQLPSGIFRTTAPDRFREFDNYLNGILSTVFPADTALDVHDWAASDCSAAAAWFHILRQAFPQAHLTASDLSLYLVEASSDSGDCYIFDATGAVLQYVRPPFVIRLSTPEPRFLWVNRLLRSRALARLQAHGLNGVASLEFAATEELHQPPFVFRKLSMVHPAAETLRIANSAFRVERHSVFEVLARPADVIRSMNIFNTGYFDEERLRQGAVSVWRSLKPGGIWIVGRTVESSPPRHHASVLLRSDHGFALRERNVQKSEVEDLALALRLDA